jgi:hypothetical protein
MAALREPAANGLRGLCVWPSKSVAVACEEAVDFAGSRTTGSGGPMPSRCRGKVRGIDLCVCVCGFDSYAAKSLKTGRSPSCPNAQQ